MDIHVAIFEIQKPAKEYITENNLRFWVRRVDTALPKPRHVENRIWVDLGTIVVHDREVLVSVRNKLCFGSFGHFKSF